jgi:hypothetical protein
MAPSRTFARFRATAAWTASDLSKLDLLLIQMASA